jgi:hypothetical protein
VLGGRGLYLSLSGWTHRVRWRRVMSGVTILAQPAPESSRPGSEPGGTGSSSLAGGFADSDTNIWGQGRAVDTRNQESGAGSRG